MTSPYDAQDSIGAISDPCEIGNVWSLKPPATVLVIFGASGDLARRKLLPALANLASDSLLPERFSIIGAARSNFSDDEFRARVRHDVQMHSRRSIPEDVLVDLADHCFYSPLDANKSEDFETLKFRLEEVAKRLGGPLNIVFYMATAPELFVKVTEGLVTRGLVDGSLVSSGLISQLGDQFRSSIVVFEKPFGRDLASAQELNRQLRQHLAEEQIYRIDHYLGKETVQSILGFRFKNRIVEPLLCKEHVDSIQISICEDIGVEGRAGYFDTTGILRDIVQNHALQMLALLCMSAPGSLLDADSIRNQKSELLRHVRIMSPSELASRVVRGRYTSGSVGSQTVAGYLDEPGVDPSRETETYVALALDMPTSWRWSGVPVFIRAGKRLKKRVTEITVVFKDPPANLSPECSVAPRNVLSFQVQPTEGIRFTVNSKHTGPRMAMRPVDMDFNIPTAFGVPSPDAYERLLLDAMNHDATLFTRNDEIEAAWRILEPVFAAWDAGGVPLFDYRAGSWGPKQAQDLLTQHGTHWMEL